MRELIRRNQERLQFRDLLLAGARSPIMGEADAAYFDGLRKKAGSRAAGKTKKA